jgi:hypothetical protein
MATQNVNIGVNVSDNGTAKKVVKSFQEIESAASRAQRAAQGINTPQAGTGGSRAVYAKSAPTGSQQMMDNQGYGSARGTAGLTGASARDFANQAQGLGGLVRLYATYAANVFAVSAAFTALSNAMDTTNMIKGLDQLGAATGRNLGGLSKRLVEITDGAISFKDSMEAVAKTTSAGMASKDVERLAMVAKNASLALGVAMPDAMNRLSRGITKLEPELLDELGIFTKIDPAVQAYSRAVGKAASQLTDFERRQAFANAVLAEGEAKFGELATAAVNPYDTLLASLKNVTQQALEVVNKALGPLVSVLASSPGALAGALAVLGTVLLRQAIPALTEFKAGLASAADSATAVAKGKAEDAKAARARIDKDIIAEVENRAAKEIDAVDRAEQKIRDLRKAGYKKDSLAAKLLAQDLDDIRKEDLAKQDEIARRLESRATRMAKDPSANPEAIRNAQKAAEANREVVTSLTSAIQAQEKFFNTEKRIVEETEKAAKGRSIYGLTIQASLNAQDAATKKNIVSNAAYNASLIGMTGAFRLMNAEIAKAGLTLNIFQLSLLKAKAGIAMLVGVIGTLSAVINGLLGVIGIIATVVGILDSVLSKASKEMDVFNSALTKVDDAAANAARTLAHLDKKGGYATATIDGISAMANAFVELSSSAKEAVDSATSALARMGTWEKVLDKVFSVFGGGVEKNLAKALTKNVTSALDLLTKSGVGEEARKTFKDILGVDSLDTESVNNAILTLSDSAKNRLVTALNEANIQLNITASRLQSFKSASESTTKAYQDFILSTANTNPVFRLGSNLENLAKTMENVTLGGFKEMEAAMISLSESPQQGILFGGEFTSQLVGLRKGFLDQAAAVTAYENRLQDLDKQIEATSATMDGLQEGTQARSIAGQDLAQLKKDRETIQKTIDLLPREKILAARDLFNKGLDNAFTEGSRLISIGLGQAAEKAAQTIAKARLGGLTGENLAREQLRINQKDIQIQLDAVNTNISLILSQERLRASIDLSNARAATAQAKQENRPTEVIDRLTAGELAAEGMVTLLGQGRTPNLGGTRDQIAQRAGIADNPDAARILANQALGLNAQLGAQFASRRELKGAQTAANVTGQREIVQGSIQDLNKEASLQQAITTQQQTRLGILTSISGISTRDSVVQQNMFEIGALSTRQMEEQRNINAAITNSSSKEEELKQEGYKRLILIRQEEELRNLFVQNRQRLLQVEIDQINKRTELERSGTELQNTLRSTALDTQSQELALYNSAYDVSRQVQITQQASLDIQKAQLETSTAVAQAEAALQQKREEARARLNALGEGEGARAKEINDELDRQVLLTNNTIAGLTAQGAAKTSILEKTREINLEQERYNLLLQTSESLASSLGEVFGELGASLGGVTKAFTEIAISSEKRAKAEELALNARINAQSTGNEDDILSAQKALEATRKKNAREALSDDIKLVNSTKKVFKEKTGAYKILNSIEKVMHVTRLAMDLKELAVKISTTTAGLTLKAGAETAETGMTFAGTMARLPAYAAEIYGKTIGQLGPIAGPAVATALVAAMFGMFGKGSSKGAFVPNAEQRQETQGTAMGFDSQGNKVQVRRGVFGDTDAKSESIANSLEILKDNSVDGLSYENRTVNLLESIDRGINNTAKGLYGIQGLRTGSMFGTVTGSQSGGGLLGTGFLGSKTSRNITDSGLLIEGTFAQLASDTNEAVIDFFEQVTVSKKSWYGRTKTWVETNRQEIDNATSDFFRDIFGNATKLFVEVAGKANIEQSVVNQILGSMSVGQNFTSLRGLKGEDFQRELSAVIGTILDDAALAIFSSFTSFAKFGEGMLETVIRVVDTNTKINQQIKNVGISSNELSFAITETLTDLAGGLENFLKQSNSFRENFLTEGERLVPVQKAVTAEMARLGFASVVTRAQFKTLVQGLDLTTKAGLDNYQALMNVADGFDTILDYTEAQADALKESAQSFRDFLTQVKDFKNSLLLGASSTLSPGEKYAEAKTQFNTIYAQALAGDKTAMSKVTGSAQTFLEASRTYFASSDAYTADFNTVLTKLDNATISAGASASVAQLQLDALNINTNLLSSIDANIATIAGVPGLAGGGRASGLTLVGEVGPELVDFTAPGRVYSADQTAGMFTPRGGNNQAMGAVVVELQQLRKEVTQLRKDQQQQTGDLIMSNYDANQKASEEIATAVTSTSQNAAWNTRSKSQIV